MLAGVFGETQDFASVRNEAVVVGDGREKIKTADTIAARQFFVDQKTILS